MMAPKRYTLTFEKHRGYLYAHVRAEAIDPEMVLAYLQEIADEAARVHLDRVLILRDIPMTLAVGDVHLTSAAAVEVLKDLRIAFLNPHIKIAQAIDFTVSAANGRGIKARLCKDRPEAEWWLMHGDDPMEMPPPWPRG